MEMNGVYVPINKDILDYFMIFWYIFWHQLLKRDHLVVLSSRQLMAQKDLQALCAVSQKWASVEAWMLTERCERRDPFHEMILIFF